MRTPIRWMLAVIVSCCAATASAEDRVLSTTQELASYALGVQVAFSIRQQAGEFEMDPGAVAMAIEDVLGAGDLRYSPEELQTAMVAYQQELQEKRGLAAEENLREAVAFLDANRSKTGISETESGLQYEVLQAGDADGESPAAGSTVLVHYRGTLIDGTEFDSSYARGEPTSLQSDQVITAWQEALAMMKPGDRWKLYVHPELGYGERGSGATIGPNQAMIFEVELLSAQ